MTEANTTDPLVDMMIVRASLFSIEGAPLRDAGELLLSARALILSLVATLDAPTPEYVEEHREMALDLGAHITRVKWQSEDASL